MVNNALVEHYKLFLLTVETFAPLQLVVSKCALWGQKSLPCVKGGGTACRDGGIVKGESSSLNNPSAAFGVSSLYTREPLAVFARLPAIPFIKLSFSTRG